MAKNGTRLQKHYTKPIQRKTVTTSNTSTRLRRVYTLVSAPEPQPLENDSVVMDPLDAMNHPDMVSEQLSEPMSPEIDCPAGINVRVKPPRNENSVSCFIILSNICILLFRTRHYSLGRNIVRIIWIHASHWKAEAATINLISVPPIQIASNQPNSVVGSASAADCTARVASSADMKIDPYISLK